MRLQVAADRAASKHFGDSRNAAKQVRGPVAHVAGVAGEVASCASGDKRGRSNVSRVTSHRRKAGPWIRRAARRLSYTPPTESGSSGPTVRKTDWSTTPRSAILATSRTLDS